MSTRERLRQLVEELPEGEVATAARILQALRDTAGQATEWSLDDAPEDDEPESPAERTAVRAAKRRSASGGALVPHEEARRMLLEEP